MSYNEIPISWEKHENFIEQLLEMPYKYIWVDKLAQTGFTTSLGKVCKKKHRTFVEFAPTNRILIETVGGKIMGLQSSGIHPAYIFGLIGSNELMCPRSCKDALFDIYHTSCHECEIQGTDACYYYLVTKTDYPVYGITYDKFRIMESKKSPMGFMAKELREKIFNSDVILLDEFARYIAYQPPGFFLKDALIIKEYVNNRRYMLPLEQQLLDDLNTFTNGIYQVSQTLGDANEFRIYHNDEILDSEGNLPALKGVSKLGKSCLDIMKTHKKDIGRIYNILGDKLSPILQNIMASMTYREIYITQMKDKNSGATMPYVFPNISHPFFSIMKPFLEEYKGKVIATGMVLPPFDTLNWHKVFFPDFNNTQDKHLVVCDRKNAYYGGSAPDWYKDKEKIQNLILQVKQLHREKIMVFAFNKDRYKELVEWRDGLVRGIKNPTAF